MSASFRWLDGTSYRALLVQKVIDVKERKVIAEMQCRIVNRNDYDGFQIHGCSPRTILVSEFSRSNSRGCGWGASPNSVKKLSGQAYRLTERNIRQRQPALRNRIIFEFDAWSGNLESNIDASLAMAEL